MVLDSDHHFEGYTTSDGVEFDGGYVETALTDPQFVRPTGTNLLTFLPHVILTGFPPFAGPLDSRLWIRMRALELGMTRPPALAPSGMTLL